MSRFEILPTGIGDLSVIVRKPIADERGSLTRIYSEDELARFGFASGIVQINHTTTAKKGALRGMHFQWPPHAEAKLVSCIRGRVFDVAIDLRKGSPSFLQWHGEELSAANHRALLIPEGFAHGFQTLEDGAELLYLHSAAYQPSAEGGVHHADPKIGICWPEPVMEVSARDAGHAFLDDTFEGILL